MLEPMLFYFFAGLAALAASMVVVSKNPVRAVLFLILTFVATAGTWLLLEMEFLAIALVLVYVGAVMVLFLFVVMMLDVEMALRREGFTRYLPLGVSVAALLLIVLVVGVGPDYFGAVDYPRPASYPADYSNIQALGTMLFTDYLFHLEIAGLMLLVAIVAAISLAFRGRQKSKAQNPAQQVRVRPENRIRILKGLSPTSPMQNEDAE